MAATNFSFIKSLGGTSSGTGTATFSTPRGVATDGNYVWIADAGNHRIKQIRLEGLSFVAHWGDIDVSTGLPASGSGDTGFSSPDGILYWNGLIFVSDTGNNRIKIHRSHDGVYINQITGFLSPSGLAGNQQYLWVCDTGNSAIKRIKFSTLAVEQSTGSSGTGVGQLDTPKGIAYDSHERVIYIADQNNSRVLKWEAFGSMTFRDTLTTATLPVGVAVKDHILYVLATFTLTAYSASTLVSQASQGGAGTDNTNIGTGSRLGTYENILLFTDSSNHRLMLWHNYLASRAFASGDSPTIGGSWWNEPITPIGAVIAGETPTIGGTDEASTKRWISEELSHESAAWVRTG